MRRSYDFSRLQVLIAEDNRHMQMLVSAMLEEFGVRRPARAFDGSEALRLMQAAPVDLLITDYQMAPMGGIELVRHIRTAPDSPNPYLPIIMMTGHTERSRVLEAREAGVTEFLAKPISVDTLLLRLANCIERPRPFVRTRSYFGPCRRRLKLEEFAGADRRGHSLAPPPEPPPAARVGGAGRAAVGSAPGPRAVAQPEAA